MANRTHHYVKGLRAVIVPAAHGAMVGIESKPIDDVTTSDIKLARQA